MKQLKIDLKDLGECVKKVIESYGKDRDDASYLFDVLNINDLLRILEDFPEGTHIAITKS